MDENNEQGWLTQLYWKIFDWFAAPGQRFHAVRAFKLHSVLFTFTFAQSFMWLFAWLGPAYIDHPLMNWGPGVCIAISWAGLLAYKFTHNLYLCANLFILASTSYIFIFCWVMDGFRQTTFAWFGIVPVVAGMLTNRLWAGVWSFTVVFLGAFGYWAAQTGLAQNLLSTEGHSILTIIQQMGFLSFIGIITYFLLRQQKVSSEYLREKVISKQNLLRILVHDISTPLSVMRLTSQMLAHGMRDTDPKVAGMKIDKNGERIANIIHLIRDLESWEANHKNVPAQPLELVSILDQVIELYQNRLTSKNIQIAKFYSSEIYVLGHETLLVHQIFGNILSNAIKFSHEGGRIELAIEPASAHSVSVIIRDYGIGIPKQTREDLFDPLAVTTRRGTAGEPGSGFGLSITKNCVHLLGGKVSLRSRTKEESPDDFGTSLSVMLRRASEDQSR